MKYQAGRYHVITWSHDSGEDSKGDFSTKARAIQDMRQRVKVDGYDGAAVFDRANPSARRRLWRVSPIHDRLTAERSNAR